MKKWYLQNSDVSNTDSLRRSALALKDRYRASLPHRLKTVEDKEKKAQENQAKIDAIKAELLQCNDINKMEELNKRLESLEYFQRSYEASVRIAKRGLNELRESIASQEKLYAAASWVDLLDEKNDTIIALIIEIKALQKGYTQEYLKLISELDAEKINVVMNCLNQLCAAISGEVSENV